MKKNKATYLPLWMPVDAWAGYIEMRRRIGKPMTEYAKKLAINKLAELVAQGQSPTAVLEQSIFNSWQGLFPIREAHSCTQPRVGQAPRPEEFGVRINPEALARIQERERQRQIQQSQSSVKP